MLGRMSYGQGYGYGQQQQPYGYQPPPRPPPRPFPVWAILLIVGGGLAVLVLVAVAALAVGSSGSGATARPAATPPPNLLGDLGTSQHVSSYLPDDAERIATYSCGRLVSLGVARRCFDARNSSAGGYATFEVVGGFPGDVGHVDCLVNDAAYSNGGSPETDPMLSEEEDDYPHLWATSSITRVSVYWDTGPKSAPDNWDRCLGFDVAHGVGRKTDNAKSRTVAACAKQYPAEYARFRSLRAAAQRVVDNAR